MWAFSARHLSCCCCHRSRSRCRLRADRLSTIYPPSDSDRWWERHSTLTPRYQSVILLCRLSQSLTRWFPLRSLSDACVDFQHDSNDLKIARREEEKENQRLVKRKKASAVNFLSYSRRPWCDAISDETFCSAISWLWMIGISNCTRRPRDNFSAQSTFCL